MPRRTFSCPHCEADVPRGALACPACGSDASTGWSDEADAWAGDLPAGYGDDEDEFDERAFLRREGLLDEPRSPRELLPSARTLLIVLLLASLLAWLLVR